MPAEMHETSLIALLAVGFVLALLFGLRANSPRVSPIVGLFTPGFVGDTGFKEPLGGTHALAGRDSAINPEGP